MSCVFEFPASLEEGFSSFSNSSESMNISCKSRLRARSAPHNTALCATSSCQVHVLEAACDTHRGSSPNISAGSNSSTAPACGGSSTATIATGGATPNCNPHNPDNELNFPPHTVMLPSNLAARMEGSTTFLLLDCRPFIAYNLNHIIGALNISCTDRFSKRRLQKGRANIIDFVCGLEGKEAFRERYSADIVIYDDSWTQLDSSIPTGPLALVLQTLWKEGRKAFILKGGLTEFQLQYNHLCAKPDLDALGKQPLYSPTTPLVEPRIDTATASEVLSFLYLGNERDAANRDRLRDLGVTHVLNVTPNIPVYFETDPGLTCKRLPASDCANQNLRQHFRDAFHFIDEARRANGRVLIHCQAGISRSATITIAFIMKHTLMKMTDAYKFVKSKRHIIAPNFNFMGQLLEFEEALNRGEVQRELEPALLIETSV